MKKERSRYFVTNVMNMAIWGMDGLKTVMEPGIQSTIFAIIALKDTANRGKGIGLIN
jgi:hypothetical protein